MHSHDETRRVILRLLGMMATAGEVRTYLKRFADPERGTVVVVGIDAAVLREDQDATAAAIAFLRQVGVHCIAVHGAPPGADSDPEGLVVAADLLVGALHRHGAQATPIVRDVFHASRQDMVALAPVEAALASGAVPVLAGLARTESGGVIAMEGDAACALLAQTVESRKVVLLNAAGGLLDADGKVMHSVNLATDYEAMSGAADLAPASRDRLRAIHDLLQRLPATASVSLVRPQGLAQELFTHGGAGTLVRRGERILALRYWHTVDNNRFEALVQASFGRSLTDDYFATTPLQAAYFVESYRAGAVVASSLQAPVLDKFMVADDAQGEGLGWAIWRHVVEAHPKLLWRARADNPVNGFYFRQADGSLRRDDWIVFWRGIDDLATVKEAVETLLKRPASLVRGDVER